ncbi:MAG: DUF3341 domain-containing protein [Bacteroidota bacterium]
MADKTIYAMYDDDNVLKDAAQSLVDKGIHIKDCYSPFPIHGIDPIIGVTRTRLGIAAFMYGLMGTCLALIGMRYFMIVDWPMIIGGKPNWTLFHNLPAFVPVTFEFTVLCAAHGMAITYFIRNKTLPGMPAVNPDPRTTDDKFVLEIDTHENHGMSAEDIISAVKETPIVELSENTH